MNKIQKQIPMERLMARQFSHWLQSRVAGRSASVPIVRPTITISKEIGSGGEELGRRISERCEWKLFDKEIVEDVARNAHVRREIVESFDEKTQNEIHNWVSTLLDRYMLSSDTYFMHLVTVIISLGKLGNVVVLGRGANFVLTPEKTLRLRVIASKPDRISYVSRSQNISEFEAKSLIDRVDGQRKAFIRKFFHQDADNDLFYDLVLNLTFLSLENAENIVLTALSQKFQSEHLMN